MLDPVREWERVSLHRDRDHAILTRHPKLSPSDCQLWPVLHWKSTFQWLKSENLWFLCTFEVFYVWLNQYFVGTFQSRTIRHCWRVCLWVRRSRYPERGETSQIRPGQVRFSDWQVWNWVWNWVEIGFEIGAEMTSEIRPDQVRFPDWQVWSWLLVLLLTSEFVMKSLVMASFAIQYFILDIQK